MKEVFLDEIEIEVQPELAEVILRKKLAREYFCWLIAKKLDKIVGDGGGKVNKRKLVDKLTEILDRSRFSVARYLDGGDNIFWRFNKDKSVLYLNSQPKVCLSLGLNHIYSYNVLYDLLLVNDSFGHCKKILLSAVASKSGNPVSNVNLAERCGVCERSVRNYLNCTERELKISKKVRNFEFLSCHDGFQSAKDELYRLGRIWGTIIRKFDGNYWLLKQIPNSIINMTGRSPVKHEKKALKDAAGAPAIQKHKKRYIKSGTELEGCEYLCTVSEKGDTLCNSGGKEMNIFIMRGK